MPAAARRISSQEDFILEKLGSHLRALSMAKHKSTQTLIIGDTPGTAILAGLLKKQGKDFLHFGRRTSPLSNKNLAWHSWGFLPSNENNWAALKLLEGFLPEGAKFITKNRPCHTYESGKFKDFLGFGSLKVDGLENYQDYFIREEILPSCGWTNFWEEVFTTSANNYTGGSELTKIEKLDDSYNLTFNGSQNITTKSVFYGNELKPLARLLADLSLPKGVYQKLNRSKSWTSISQSYSANQAITPGGHWLMGSKEIPVIGGMTGETKLSQWFSLISAELTLDDESTGTNVKEARRQLKRAYPEVFTDAAKWRTSVEPYAFGFYQGITSNTLELKSAEGFFLTTGLVSDKSGMSAELSIASQIFNEQCQSSEIVDSQATDNVPVNI